MKIYYSQSSGEIIKIVSQFREFWTDIKISYPYSVLEIDEIDPENKELCSDLKGVQGQVDVNGDAKYYMSGGELYERDNWESYVEVERNG